MKKKPSSDAALEKQAQKLAPEAAELVNELNVVLQAFAKKQRAEGSLRAVRESMRD